MAFINPTYNNITGTFDNFRTRPFSLPAKTITATTANLASVDPNLGVIIANPNAAATWTLPALSTFVSYGGQFLWIYNQSAYNVTLAPAGSDNINGADTDVVLSGGNFANLIVGGNSQWTAVFASNTQGIVTTTDTGFGYQALAAATVTDNSAFGAQTLSNLTTGTDNTAVGFQALQANTTGFNNIAVGSQAMQANTTGYSNTAIGFQALTVNTSGADNTAVGFQALQANTTGSNNVAVGLLALNNNTSGSNNIAVGLDASLNNTIGSSNTSIGFGALYNNTTGSSNTSIGYKAMFNSISGTSNTAVGYNSGDALSSGSNNTVLGANIDLGANSSDAIVISGGTGVTFTASNAMLLGNGTTTSPIQSFISGPTSVLGYETSFPSYTHTNTQISYNDLSMKVLVYKDTSNGALTLDSATNVMNNIFAGAAANSCPNGSIFYFIVKNLSSANTVQITAGTGMVSANSPFTVAANSSMVFGLILTNPGGSPTLTLV